MISLVVSCARPLRLGSLGSGYNPTAMKSVGIYSCLFRNDGFTTDAVYVGIYNTTEAGNNGKSI